MNSRPASSSFSEWSNAWLELARFSGRDVAHPDARIEQLLRLWAAEVPGLWRRSHNGRLADPETRYQRNHKHGAPTPGSEHELEREILDPDPRVVTTTCFGARLLDGVNAVPLAADPAGGRSGNVEADMILLTSGSHEELLLVEAKTTSNNAWYAAVENLRQLKLFSQSPIAQRILPRGQRDDVDRPVACVVLGPKSFFDAPGAKAASVSPTGALQTALRQELGVDLRLATWDPATRRVEESAPR